jgi:hypothetical protein
MDSDDSPDEGQKNSGENSNPSAPGGAPESGGKTTPPEDPKSIAKETLQRVKMTEVLLVVLTGVIAASSVTTCYVYNRQLGVMQDTLDEIRVSGIDTHHLSSAMGRSAVAMHGLVEQTTTLAEQTTSLATYAGKAAIAAEKSQAATEKLARATADAAVASHSLAESAGQSSASTQRLASAAIDANAVSRELVNTAQQASSINRNVARAYVFATDIKLNPIMAPFPPYKPMGWTADITWENTGNTPTTELVVSANCWGDIGTLFDDLDVAKKHPAAFDVATIKPGDKALMKMPDEPHLIGPKGSKHSIGCVIDPLAAAYSGLGVFSLYYYSFGTARYKDVFGSPHRTDFCFVMRLTGNGEVDYMDPATVAKGNLKTLGIESGSCQKHNCADEECDAEPLKLVAVAPAEPEPTKQPTKPPG